MADPPPLEMLGELVAEHNGRVVRIVGVADGVEIRLDTLRTAWALRSTLGELTSVPPLDALGRWWRLSGITLHLVVAGRRIAWAEPIEPFDRRVSWMPAPWRPRLPAVLAALGAALVGRG
ncbi:MAG: hypothetical protein AAF823_06410 [Planctomycetota bacterium]